MNYPQLKMSLYDSMSVEIREKFLIDVLDFDPDVAKRLASKKANVFIALLNSYNIMSAKHVKLYLWKSFSEQYQLLLQFYGEKRSIIEEPIQIVETPFATSLRNLLQSIMTVSEPEFQKILRGFQSLGAESVSDLKYVSASEISDAKILKMIQARKLKEAFSKY